MANNLLCPVCQTSLHDFSWNKIEINVCDKCEGVWFDFGEMKFLSDSDNLENIDRAFKGTYQEGSVSQAMVGPNRQCPRDGSTLERHEWNGDSKIVMDYCNECYGTWLDSGELEGYVAHIKGLESSPNGLTQEIRSEVQRVKDSCDTEIKNYVNNMDFNAFTILAGTLGRALTGKRK